MTSREAPTGEVQTISVRLAISPEKYKAYYQGQVQFIQAQSNDGRSIRFPANAVRQFLTVEGVHGEFEIRIDQNNKLVGVSRKE